MQLRLREQQWPATMDESPLAPRELDQNGSACCDPFQIHHALPIWLSLSGATMLLLPVCRRTIPLGTSEHARIVGHLLSIMCLHMYGSAQTSFGLACACAWAYTSASPPAAGQLLLPAIHPHRYPFSALRPRCLFLDLA